MSLQDRETGKSRVHMYPTSKTSKAPLSFIAKDYPDDLRVRLAGLLPEPLRQSLVDGKTFPASPKALGGWEKTKPVFDEIFRVSVSSD